MCLMRCVRVRGHQTYSNTLHLFAAKGLYRILDIASLEWFLFTAAILDSLPRGQTQIARRKWVGGLEMIIILLLADATPHRHRIAESFSGEQARARTVACQHGISGDRRAMHNQFHVAHEIRER